MEKTVLFTALHLYCILWFSMEAFTSNILGSAVCAWLRYECNSLLLMAERAVRRVTWPTRRRRVLGEF